MKNKQSPIWIIAGSICVALGIIGIFLPVLPTTPFLLLAAFCYSRGSQTLYRKLLNQSILGSYIRDYQEGKGVPLAQKIISITFLWLTIGGSIMVVKPSLWLSFILLVVAIGVTVHLATIKTKVSGDTPLVSDPLSEQLFESDSPE